MSTIAKHTPGPWVRADYYDTRIRRGDDYASDGWVNLWTGEIKRVAVGHDPNAAIAKAEGR